MDKYPDSNRIIETFIENVYEETGIQLEESDITAEINKSTLAIIFKADKISEIDFEPEEEEGIDEDELALQLIEEIGDIKALLVKRKIAELEKYVSKQYDIIKDHLNNFLSIEQMDDLYFEIKDLGYNSMHYEMEEEVSKGYPIIAISITDFEELNFSFPLNVYYPEDSFIMKELLDQLDDYISELNI